MLDSNTKKLPTNVVWLTGRTEIRTEEGWQSLEHLYNNRHLKVMTANLTLKKVERRPVFTMSKMPFRGEISTLRTESQYMEFRYANPIDKCEIFPSMLETGPLSHEYKRIPYKGDLFTLTVPNQTIFCRNTKNSHRGVNPFVLATTDEDAAAEAYEIGESDHLIVEGEVDRHSIRDRYAKLSRDTIYQRATLPEYWITKTTW